MGSFDRKFRRSGGGVRPIRPGTVQSVPLMHTLTIVDLEANVRGLAPGVIATGTPVYVQIAGFDEDPRELGEIPEARALCERLVDSGFIGILGDNADHSFGNAMLDARCALYLARGWLFATSGKGARLLITDEREAELLATLERAKGKVDALLADGGPVGTFSVMTPKAFCAGATTSTARR